MKMDYDYNNNYKIKDLELILEMFNRGLLKENQNNSYYNLIKAIADYSRSVKKINKELYIK